MAEKSCSDNWATFFRFSVILREAPALACVMRTRRWNVIKMYEVSGRSIHFNTSYYWLRHLLRIFMSEDPAGKKKLNCVNTRNTVLLLFIDTNREEAKFMCLLS